jgi:glyoxylate reductase
MSKPKVFVTRRLVQEALDRLDQEVDLVVWPGGDPPPRQTLMESIQDVEGLLCLLTDSIDAEVLSSARRLRAVSNLATGYDNIDVETATRLGISVGNTPRVLDNTTADYAFALILASSRHLVEADRHVRQGNWHTWEPLGFLGQDVHGATLGIVGLGAIGTEVAKRALGFGMRVVYHTRTRRQKEEELLGLEYAERLEELLQLADFVSLHLPLTPDTYQLIDSVALQVMKPTAVLVNTGRGPLVDTMALYHALNSGVIARAALDVTDPEPLDKDHPLLKLENVIVTPHIASATRATRERMAHMAVDNVLAALRGQKMPNCVNPEVFGAG